MKRKIPLYMSLVAMLVLSMAMVNAVAYVPPSEPPYAWFYIEPDPKTIGPTADNLTGTRFTVDVKVHNITNMLGYEFKLGFDNTLINVTGADAIGRDTEGNIVPGPAQPTNPVYMPGATINSDYYWVPLCNITLGYVWAGSFSIMGPPFSGSGTLMTINFTILKAPPRPGNLSCVLNLYDVVPVDPLANVIPCGVDDGLYWYARTAPGVPQARFTWSPPTPYECDDVVLDASTSDDGGEPPLTYEWTVTGDGTLIGANDTKITTMHCDGVGNATVFLKVTNKPGISSNVTHVIPQKERLGCILDIYTGNTRFCGQWTPNVGKGLNENADAFAPGDWVWLYADVTYNGAPVNHVLVTFEVWDNTNSCVTYRVAETNKDGIANTSFRIPVPCDVQLFGKWLVMASAKVQDVKQMDFLKFDVGWILEITDAWTTFEGKAETTFYRPCDDIDFHIVVKNIAWISKNVTIVIVVYDECHVPLGQVIVRKTIAGGAYCSPNNEPIDLIETIHVPQWAYIGGGKVYYNLLTALPSECGVAYSPEYSTDIAIALGPRP